MLKGVLGLLLLSALSTGDHYGYGLVTQLRSAGFDELAEGTVYPGLTRLENAGLLDSYLLRSASGPARKYYRLTEAGAVELSHRRTSWSDLVQSVATATSTSTSTSTSITARTTHSPGEPA